MASRHHSDRVANEVFIPLNGMIQLKIDRRMKWMRIVTDVSSDLVGIGQVRRKNPGLFEQAAHSSEMGPGHLLFLLVRI